MKHQKRYNPNDLQIFTIIKKDIYVEPTTIYDRIFSVYGKVFKCVTQTVTLDSIDSISKKDIEECIDKVISKFKFEYKIINEKIRKPQDLAIIYNDLRRLGIISIGSGGSWKKDKPAKLTPLGQRIKICLNRLDDEKIGALLVTLCRQMQNLSNELLKNEAGYCFKDQLTKNEEELFRRANEVLGSFNPDATCSPLTSKVRVVVQNFLDLAILSVLVSGKNLLLLGSPGSGKTSYLVNFLNSLGIKYTIKTGNPEWTAFDVVGGYTLSGWRDGFLTRIFREYSDIHWLLIDEFNRANIDMCFGEYFTMLDVEYRDQAVAIGNVKSESIKVPYSFRVLGTFNSYDKSGLHKLGYALMRRFAIVNFDIFINGEKLKEK
ncbi:MAG: AAA family ATPase, partial [Pyrobaculum sp.]